MYEWLRTVARREHSIDVKELQGELTETKARIGPYIHITACGVGSGHQWPWARPPIQSVPLAPVVNSHAFGTRQAGPSWKQYA